MQSTLGKIAVLSQLKKLQLDVGWMSQPKHLTKLTSLKNLQWVAVHGSSSLHWPSLRTCAAAWKQVQVLDLGGGQSLDWAALQVLASLPHLHSLTCSGIILERGGQVCLSALRSLSFSRGSDTWHVSPAQHIGLSLPNLESMSGELTVTLIFSTAQDSGLKLKLKHLRRVAGGILQWAHEVRIELHGTPDPLVKIMQALAAWRPVQRGHACRLILDTRPLDSNQASVRALSHLPFAVQELR
jgi:hypothetical protein